MAKKILTVAFTLAMMAVAIVLSCLRPSWTADATADGLITDMLVRVCVAAVFFLLLLFGGYGDCLRIDKRKLRALPWCVPCLLVAVVNFPFSALIGGGARVDRGDLIGLFVLYCLSVSLMEEAVFRGVLYGMIAELFPKKDPFVDCKTVLVSSAIFSAVHLFNLFTAGMGATLLQIGYTFLIGVMLSAVLLKTGSLWVCVLLHALFDFGGLLVPTLGGGVAWDGTFWLLTAVVGVLCAGHIVAYFYKNYPFKNPFKNKKEK